LLALCFAANNPVALASFWGGVLGRELSDEDHDGMTLLPGDDREFPIRFHPSRLEKVQPNQMHFDLTSTSLEDQQQTVARALDLGARHLDIGQGPDAAHVVLADPEGNEFCVIEPGNTFLADCGSIGALAGDGTQEVGYFWSEALGWPLVWDQDLERRSPGAVRPLGPRRRRTGCTSTSYRRPPVTPTPRPTACCRSGRPGETGTRPGPAGSRCPIPTATSSA
jgi:catechol 2,3-dioxygenase-like lactoylglutathione lyase family enzyme